MATPGLMVKVVADTLGFPHATVTLFDRVLAEGGYRSKGGRGLSAAQVTHGDVANLLIALLGTPPWGTIGDAVKTCKSFGTLPVQLEHFERAHSYGLKTLASLPQKHSFHDGLTALIKSAGVDRFEIPSDNGEHPLEYEEADDSLRASLMDNLTASIRCDPKYDNKDFELFYHDPSADKEDPIGPSTGRRRANRLAHGYLQVRSINFGALREIETGLGLSAPYPEPWE